MEGENCTVFGLRLMNRLAMSHNRSVYGCPEIKQDNKLGN